MLPKINSLWEFMIVFPDDKACRDYLTELRWAKTGISCPHCKHKKVYTYADNLRYKCAKCYRQFRATTGTVFESRNIPLQKFFLAYYLITSSKKGISSIQLSKYLQITVKTAWFLEHKIRKTLTAPKTKLSRKVEMDETYIGGKRRFSKRGRNTDHKTPVFGILERGGGLRIFPVPDVKAATLKEIIYREVEAGSIVMTDEFRVYKSLSKDFKHKTVKHKIRQYVDGDTHTNSIEGFWSIIKRGIKGVYHRPSRKYLREYCNEFEFRYNTRGLTENNRFRIALQKGLTKTVKFQDIRQ